MTVFDLLVYVVAPLVATGLGLVCGVWLQNLRFSRKNFLKSKIYDTEKQNRIPRKVIGNTTIGGFRDNLLMIYLILKGKTCTQYPLN
jgi:hypothetical protein